MTHDQHANVSWNERVNEWEEVAASPAFQRLADNILEHASPTLADRVVDIGAGTGLLTLRVAPLVRDVLAIDAAPAMVERVIAIGKREGLENISGAVADLRELGLPDGSRTLAISNYAYHHVDHEDKRVALQDLYRVLAPGGRVVICDMMFAVSLRPRDRRIIWDKVKLISKRGPAGVLRVLKNAGKIATGTWEHPERPEAWEQLLTEIGFVEVASYELTNESGLVTARRP